MPVLPQGLQFSSVASPLFCCLKGMQLKQCRQAEALRFIKHVALKAAK